MAYAGPITRKYQRGCNTTLMLKILASLLFVTVVVGFPTEVRAHGDHGRRVMRCHRIDWSESRTKMARLIRCVANVWNSPGTADYAVAIARCESGLNPNVIGGSNNHYLGLYQFYYRNWDRLARKYIKPLGFNNTRWRNGEVNAILAVRVAKTRGSWSGYWSCA